VGWSSGLSGVDRQILFWIQNNCRKDGLGQV